MTKKNTLLFLLVASVSFGQFRIGGSQRIIYVHWRWSSLSSLTMADNSNIGVGFNVNFSYTDNVVIPVFFYTSIGYQHYPGRQDLYKRTDYSSFSSNVLVVASGIRYYFRPMFEQVVLLMPVIDIGGEYALFENWNQFKAGSLQSNSVTELNKFGFHAGVGVSMFLLDFMAYYNYLPDANFISVDLRVNLPIFIKI